jgi:predicted patatin/cPLA2 family phospholipase
LAIVADGGAMRGTYTGGAMVALDLAGASQIFDLAFATSAGSINTAHFLTGRAPFKAATYYRSLADGRFFSPWRIMRPLDIDFVFDVVLKKEFPLEMERLDESPTPFKVAVLNADTGVAEMRPVTPNSGWEWQTLKAAVAMPVVYNRRIPLPGGRFVDGGSAIPYPLLPAIESGATDILVLLGRNAEVLEPPLPAFELVLWSVVFARGRRGVNSVFHNWLPTIRGLNDIAVGRKKSSDARICCIFPTSPKVVSATQDITLLREGCIEMARETLDILQHPHDQFNELVAGNII